MRGHPREPQDESVVLEQSVQLFHLNCPRCQEPTKPPMYKLLNQTDYSATQVAATMVCPLCETKILMAMQMEEPDV